MDLSSTAWRALGLQVVLWAVVAPLVTAVMILPQGVAVAWVSGGVAAGLLVVVPVVRWWTVLLPAGVASAWGYASLDHTVGEATARTATDLAAVVVFAVLLRRRPSRSTGLGGSYGALAAATVAACVLRMAPLTALGLAGTGPVADRVLEYWVVYLLGTVGGLLAGTALVVGLARWRDTPTVATGRRVDLLALPASFLVAVVVFVLLPITDAFGGDLLVVPVLLWAALACSVPANAALSGVVALIMAASMAQRWGVYASIELTGLGELVHEQLFFAALVVARSVLTAAMESRRAAEQRALTSLGDLERIFRQVPVPAALAVVDGDRRLRVRAVNGSFLTLFELTSVPVGQRLSAVMGTLREIDPAVPSGPALRARTAEDREVWVRPSVSRLGVAADDDGAPRRGEGTAGTDTSDAGLLPTGREVVVVLEDVTAARSLDGLHRRQARLDPLTGLVTRDALLEDLDGTTGPDRPLGVVLVDVDGLADVNETLGRTAGDQVLLTVRDRLLAVSGPEDLRVRYSGGVFAVVRRRAQDDDVRALVDRLRAALVEAVTVGGRPVVVTASVGSVHCAHERDERDVMAAADAALARARREGRGRHTHRVLGPDGDRRGRLAVELALREALDAGRLECHFQPLLDATTGRVVGLEALARLREADGTLLPPAVFIPVAAEMRLLGHLTEQVLAESCRQVRRWREIEPRVRVGINVPPTWVTPEAEGVLVEALRGHGLDGDALTLEITEDEAADLSPEALAVLQRLADRGVTLAIDDFGTGYASLTSFRDVPSQIIKIDGSFVATMTHSPEHHDLVGSVVDLAHRFGKQVVGEGVETPAQLAALTALGCDVVQGYLTGRPVPAAEVEALLVRAQAGIPADVR